MKTVATLLTASVRKASSRRPWNCRFSATSKYISQFLTKRDKNSSSTTAMSTTMDRSRLKPSKATSESVHSSNISQTPTITTWTRESRLSESSLFLHLCSYSGLALRPIQMTKDTRTQPSFNISERSTKKLLRQMRFSSQMDSQVVSQRMKA